MSSKDSTYAGVLLAFFIGVVASKRFCSVLLESLLMLTRPVATIALLGVVAYAYSKDLMYTTLILALISVYLLKDLWTTWVRSDARRLHLDVAADHARFDPMTSVDIQWGNGSATHDSPSMLESHGVEKMLVFPPSKETLESMSG
jgi:hypothetical protein